MKIIIVIIAIILLILIVIPFIIINYLDSFLIAIDGSLISFLGSYVGAIITGLVSIFCILISVYFTRKQNEKEQELKIRPYFDFIFKGTNTPISLEKDLGYIAFEFMPNIESNKKCIPNIYGLLLLKNVGLGTALHCSFSYVVSKHKRKWSRFFYSNPKMNIEVNAFQPGEEGSIAFRILLNHGLIPKDSLKFTEDGNRTLERKILESLSFVLKVKLSYSDILENWYYQELTFESRILYSEISYENEEENYNCGLSLNRISPPHKDKNMNKQTNRRKGKG